VEKGKQARKRILTTLLLLERENRVDKNNKKTAATSVKSSFYITGISSKSAGIPNLPNPCHSILITVVGLQSLGIAQGERLDRNLVPAFRLNQVPLGKREADGTILVLVKDDRTRGY